MLVYKVTCNVNGKGYVGVTTRIIEERIKEHRKYSRRKQPKCLIHRAMKKYGFDNFEFEIIENDIKTENELSNRETFYVDKFDTFMPNGYNMTHGGQGTFGHVVTEEVKQKIRDARAKQVFSQETRDLWSRQRKGRKVSAEARRKISIGNTGKVRSLEQCRKQSERMMGHVQSRETCERRSKTSKGKINIKWVSDEHLELIVDLYAIMGLKRVCEELKLRKINIGHSAAKRILIEVGAYNPDRINQYR